jgi:hypothetical protein
MTRDAASLDSALMLQDFSLTLYSSKTWRDAIGIGQESDRVQDFLSVNNSLFFKDLGSHRLDRAKNIPLSR